MLKIDIISVQPKMFEGFLRESIVARAVKKGACEINIVDLREFGEGRWRKVDDKPYGGGPGMLMKCGPWFAAVEKCLGGLGSLGVRVIMTSPAGKTFTQRDAEMFANPATLQPSTFNLQPPTSHLIFLCGHYEGFDARIETLVTDKYSIGDFVMTGGELAAAAMVDSIVRLLPGVLGGGPAATASESFGRDGLLEAPQYTHPPEFRGMKVPEVLLSGDHAAIEAWKKAEARKLTERERPDLISRALCLVLCALCACFGVLSSEAQSAKADVSSGHKAQGTRHGEVHAVWDHTGRGLYEGNWPKTISILKNAHVTDLFVNVGGSDFAHYNSAFLPKTRVCKTRGDQLTACLRAAQGAGIRVHAWFICFNATRNNPTLLETFRKRGWRLKDKSGNLLTYLDPANPAVRSYVLSAVRELARYPVAGVHLDFVRWGDAAVKPDNAAPVIAQFVAEARRQVKRPMWLTAAVYGKYPNCIAAVGQDWPRWLDFDIVDFVVPMDYSATDAKFEELLRQQASPSVKAKRTIAGIGVTATGMNLKSAQVIRQIQLVRRYGLAGQSLFDLDETLEKSVLPELRRTGTW